MTLGQFSGFVFEWVVKHNCAFATVQLNKSTTTNKVKAYKIQLFCPAGFKKKWFHRNGSRCAFVPEWLMNACWKGC